MQSRRHEDHMTMSTSSKLRNQHGKSGMGHDPYLVSRHDAPDRSRRSVSPHKVDGSRRISDGQRTSGSIERRDYGWNIGGGRTEKVRSKSPPQYRILHKRPQFDDDGMPRKYGYHEDLDFDHGTNSRLKPVYGYDHGSSRVSKEKDYNENRIVEIDGHGMLSEKSVLPEEGEIRGSYQLPPDKGHAKNYGEHGGSIPLSSRSMNIGRFEHEKLQYREPIPDAYKAEEKPLYLSRDKFAGTESYIGKEKPMYHSRDVVYTTVPSGNSKDFLSNSQYKVGSSSGTAMSEFPVSYQDDVTLPTSDGYPRSSIKLTESTGFNAYRQRPLVDTLRNTEAEVRNLTYYQHGAYSPSRTEREDYKYPKTRLLANDDRGYLSDDLRRMISPHTRLEYDNALKDYDHRDLPRASNMLPVVDRIDNPELSLRRSSALDHPTLQKQTVSDYIDMSRKSYPLKQSEEYLNPGSTHAEFEKTLPHNYGISHLGVPQDRQISYIRSDYAFGRDPGPEIQKERLQSSSDLLYDSERHKLAVRTRRIKEGELGIHEPSENVFKRKHSLEDDIYRHNDRIIMSSKRNIPEEFEDLYGSDEEYFEEDMSGVHFPKTRRFNDNEYRKTGRSYDGREHPGNYASDDWFSSRDSLANSKRYSARFYKPNSRYVKDHTRPVSLGWHNSYHSDRRSGLYKQHKLWKKNKDYDEDVHDNDGDKSEDWLNLAESEPSEDSEEFKQLAHKAFLEYSKRLNVNSSVRRRYQEQGKAGSLFCIACGRSMSKEFANTQRLVTHTFMSHKVGLRAQHLGLHKAICILLGWSSDVPQETITWVPEVLSDEEAMAAKEDLILWPPVVIIRNISMSNNNPKEQKVIPIEGVEAFIRGKGIVGGKITVCLGRPADQSIMVVKFLGTFSGLANAEKLHKYFAENKQGRKDFNRLINNGKGINIAETRMPGDKVEEHLLYGYMGISEDLDTVDYNTKKYCVIKSKAEIMDLANAPVKPNDS
ncbi:uncharacterized protein LOC116127196 [Pistacia vera]|uniref:uncharacterized protein LOC116127196 n=1 Tax=Pistacia vera TaxID=55513 RepID=UPI0012636F06|nr:uncharacterized protein LOC116127196 [Pistacia vera]